MFDEQRIVATTFYGMDIHLILAAGVTLIAIAFVFYNIRQDGVIRNLEKQVKQLKGMLESGDEKDN